MDLINELLILAGCEPIAEANISTQPNVDVEIPSQFIQAVYNIVDDIYKNENEPIQNQIPNEYITYNTSLIFKYKNSLIDGRTSKVVLRLGLTDMANSLKLNYRTDGYGLMHALQHKEEFQNIIKSLPIEDISKIQQYVRNNNPLELILLTIPFIIKTMQYRRLTSNTTNPFKDAVNKTTFIYGNMAFILYANFEKNEVFVHTFYHISKNTKQDIQNANKRYRERLQQLRTTKGA